MKFNRSKCRILHLGQSNLGYTYRMRDERLVSSSSEKILGALVDGN